MIAPRPLKLTESSSCFLDAVRGLSSQAVLFGHAISFLGLFPLLQPPHAPYMQNVAVAIFFFLSGYLISYSTFLKMNKSDYGLKEYLVERFSRIYTAYFPCLVLVALIDFLTISLYPDKYGYGAFFNIKTFVGNIFMLQYFPFSGLKDLQAFGSARPFWTLAIEWWFYLAFGWLVLMKANSPLKIFLKIAIMIPLLIVPVFNIYGRGNGLSLIWIAGSIACGFLVPYATKHIKFKVSYSLILAIVATVMTISFLARKKTPKSHTFALWMSAAFFFWVCWLQMKDFRISPWFKKLTFLIASFSFTLYLIHYTVIDFLIHLLNDKFSPEMILVLSLLLSNLLSYFISLGTENRHKEFSGWLKRLTGLSPAKVAA